MEHLFLSRRNLQTLLNKLERNLRDGAGSSECTIVKRDTLHPKYPSSVEVLVTALEDEEYYGTANREVGRMHPADEPRSRLR